MPIIDKRSGQVISITETVSIMDNETLEVIEIPIPTDETLKSKIEPGVNVEYWKILNRYMITQVKS